MSRLAGHSSHDAFPMVGLKHIDTVAAIAPHRPPSPGDPVIPQISSFALVTLVAAASAAADLTYLNICFPDKRLYLPGPGGVCETGIPFNGGVRHHGACACGTMRLASAMGLTAVNWTY